MWIVLLGIPVASFTFLILGYTHPVFYRLIGPCLTLGMLQMGRRS